MAWTRREALSTSAFWLIVITFGISHVGVTGLNIVVTIKFCSPLPWFAILPIGVRLSFTLKQPESHFITPSPVARALNRLYGWFTSLGLGPSYSFQLQIEGRKTGKRYSTPVNVLPFGEKIYLVGTRGHTQWSRNALVTETITLKRGRISMRFRLRVVSDAEKPEILKAYLTRFSWMVGRFFPVRPTSPVAAFAPIAARYPVFELLPENLTARQNVR